MKPATAAHNSGTEGCLSTVQTPAPIGNVSRLNSLQPLVSRSQVACISRYRVVLCLQPIQYAGCFTYAHCLLAAYWDGPACSDHATLCSKALAFDDLGAARLTLD